ncbi:MAG: hypothetical protein AAGD07_11460 [Planctomycetota bacterium]
MAHTRIFISHCGVGPTAERLVGRRSRLFRCSFGAATLASLLFLSAFPANVIGDDLPLEPQRLAEAHANDPQKALLQGRDWPLLDTELAAEWLRSSLDEMGVLPRQISDAESDFLSAVQQHDLDPLLSWVAAAARAIPGLETLVAAMDANPLNAAAMLDPSQPAYAALESVAPRVRAAIRTQLGRELVRGRFYDEALPVFAEVDPGDSPDAAALLYYRGACYHAMLKKSEALRDLRQLLRREDDLPTRFAQTAKLMVADIKPLKEDSLDEVSRLMTDVTRRLDLGRSDDSTREQEQLVIDKLSKLIDKLEKQQQQQRQQQQAGGGGQQSQGGKGDGSPMQDSQIAGGSGQGDVDNKDLEPENPWGNLPPAERQESLQQISKGLPTHYREAIEAYFRKLATESN